MKLLRVIQYAGYVLFHWGIRVGFYTLWHELRGELKYKIHTSGFKTLTSRWIKGSQLEHATEYMPVNYALLEELLQTLPAATKQGTFVDIGCGKGRALCVAASFGFRKVYGFDFDQELVTVAEKNLAATQKHFPGLEYTVTWSDLAEWKMTDDVAVLFLFNPFDHSMMQLLVQKIKAGLAATPRIIWVIYASPRFAEVFLSAGFVPVSTTKKAGFIEGLILKWEPT